MNPSLRLKQYEEMGGRVLADPSVGFAAVQTGKVQDIRQESVAPEMPVTEETDLFGPAKGIIAGLALSGILWSMLIPLVIYLR